MAALEAHFLDRTIFSEHHAVYDKKYRVEEDLAELQEGLQNPIFFKGNEQYCCFAITKNSKVENGYFIGVDWLVENKKAVYVQPKINRKKRKKDEDSFPSEESNMQVDYLAMLFSALQHPEVFEHTSDLFEIKWNKPEIKINQQQDMLTPLLVLQYLQVVKSIVRKGLKKSYYKVEHNLRSRVKGKVLVAQNIKQNLSKSRTLNTYCAYDEFGYNGIENRILNKALVFVERYLPTFKGIGNSDVFSHTFNYIRPAFEQVSDEASLHECRHIKANPFYKEYTQAIDLAKQILRRFGYNIQNTTQTQVSTPPFWIDMSKLFELYVLGLLRDKYGNKAVGFQVGNKSNKLDFLLNLPDLKMVIDAKYKLKYNNGGVNSSDVRQVSGYARLEIVYEQFEEYKTTNPVGLIDCLIIYPENELGVDPEEYELTISKTEENKLKDYVGVYKLGVPLPAVKS